MQPVLFQPRSFQTAKSSSTGVSGTHAEGGWLYAGADPFFFKVLDEVILAIAAEPE
jgi:hypothetical protein